MSFLTVTDRTIIFAAKRFFGSTCQGNREMQKQNFRTARPDFVSYPRRTMALEFRGSGAKTKSSRARQRFQIFSSF
jgi:hypothetical protein